MRRTSRPGPVQARFRALKPLFIASPASPRAGLLAAAACPAGMFRMPSLRKPPPAVALPARFSCRFALRRLARSKAAPQRFRHGWRSNIPAYPSKSLPDSPARIPAGSSLFKIPAYAGGGGRVRQTLCQIPLLLPAPFQARRSCSRLRHALLRPWLRRRPLPEALRFG